MLQADDCLDGEGSGRNGSSALEVSPDTNIRNGISTPSFKRKEPLSVDARKRKVIDIPMV